jgi:hypothetical protein
MNATKTTDLAFQFARAARDLARRNDYSENRTQWVRRLNDIVSPRRAKAIMATVEAE